MSEARISNHDRGLIKAAIRRAFARSEWREQVVAAARIGHHDPARPKCKKWVRCAGCQTPSPEWSSQVDHIQPLIPIGSSMLELSLDEVRDRAWCELSNLQVLCKVCHTTKTQAERDQRTVANRLKKGLPADGKKPKKPRTKK